MDSKTIAILTLSLVISSGNTMILSLTNGMRNHSFGTRIAGGVEVYQGELPYQLSLRSNEWHICGASLIELHGLQLAVTAAHCLKYWGSRDFSLVAGDINLADITGFEQTRRVVSIALHEEYNTPKFSNDLALLFLDHEFTLNYNIQPIGLPEKSADVLGIIATVSGWGEMQDGGDISDTLRAVNLISIDHDVCKDIWRRNPDPVEIGDGTFCLASLYGYEAPCGGDSGGPAVAMTDDGDLLLVGVVSFSDDYCLTDYPAGFTNIAKYVGWIMEKVASHAY